MSDLLDWLLKRDSDLFIFLNGKHLSWIDPIMIFFSAYYSWVIICILIIALLIYTRKSIGAWAVLFAAACVGINASVNNIIKIIITRPRPIHTEALEGLYRALEKYESSYSFFSAHSSNAFCIAIFTALFLRNKLYTIIIFLWAMTVAYSRIYVGKHFPLDVFCGILFGLFTGYVGYQIFLRFSEKKLSPKKRA